MPDILSAEVAMALDEACENVPAYYPDGWDRNRTSFKLRQIWGVVWIVPNQVCGRDTHMKFKVDSINSDSESMLAKTLTSDENLFPLGG